MSADCQKLNHGGIAERQVLDWVQIDLRHRIRSQSPPSVCTPSTWIEGQQFGFPCRQATQAPHAIYGLITTRVPTARREPGAVSATSPESS